MKKILLTSAVLLALTASAASAGGVNLSWGDCGGFGQQDAVFACNTNTGLPFQLFASFQPNTGMTDLVANEWAIDLQSAGATLPAWWDLKGTADPAGRCRDAGIVHNTNFASGPFSCIDPWAGAIGAQGFSYRAEPGTNRARITGVQALNAEFPVPADPATEYYSFALIINRSKTVGTPNCADCSVPVCIVLNEITLNGLASTQKVNSPLTRNFVTWQGGGVGAPGCPLATPTTKSSWGKIKSIYR